MGPNFPKADRRIGRNRLPDGYVAVLDDPERLERVIRELHAYAVADLPGDRPRLGVLYRRATAADRDGLRHKLVEHFGSASLLGRAAVFGIEDGYHFVINSESVKHV